MELATLGRVFLTFGGESWTIYLAPLTAPEGEKMLNFMNQKMNRANLAIWTLTLWAGVLCGQSTTPASPPPSPGDATTQNSALTQAVRGYQYTTKLHPPGADPESLLLQEGDTIHISFPGAPNLSSTQTIRRDGKITLDLVGEVNAAGLTPHGLEAELIKKFGDQLLVKEVSVTVQSSTFIVYVTGCVLKPGKLISERRLSPLQAVIEAGIDHDKANLKKVTVIRDTDNGQRQRFKLNLDRELHGLATEPFTLKPLDVIFVPEKFNWF
jgi:polysaccharide export outer membrane protein